MKLKQILSVSLLAAIVVPMFVAITIFSTSMTRFLTNKVEQTELPTALQEVKNAVELDLARSILPSRSLSTSEYVMAWMRAGEPQDQVPLLSKHLSSVKQQNDAVAAFVVSANSGNYYTPEGISRQVDDANDPWFADFIASNKAFDISIDIDKGAQTATAFINYAIEANGQRIGLAGVGKSLDAMTDLIAAYKIGENGIVYLVDSNNVIQLHPQQAQRGKRFDAAGLVGKINTFERDGTTYVKSAAQLDSLDWYLVTEVPESDLYGAINSAIITNVVIGIVIAIIGVVGAKALSSLIFKPIEKITGAVTELTQKDGDLTARLDIKENNEIGDLADKIDLFLEQLHAMFKQVSQSADNVHVFAGQVYEQIQRSHEFSNTQTSSTLTVAAAVEEMDLTVKEISNSAQGASEVAATTESNVNTSLAVINQTMEQMGQLGRLMNSSVDSVNELSSRIASITDVLEVIRGISEQTNLLALNAAIEAARAGEQGRGFAVVADEVRNLAKRTSDSTEEINAMISTLNATASQTVNAIQEGSASTGSTAEQLSQSVTSLRTIADEVIRLTEMNRHVATATREQSQATGEISKNVSIISETAHETTHSMETSYKLVNALEQESQALSATINRFTL